MIIITGATGHIGNNVVRLLLKSRNDIKLLLREDSDATKELNVSKAVGNLLDVSFLNKHIHKGDTIIHLAGYIDLHNKNYNLSYESNVVMTQYLSDIAFEKGLRFIYTSSSDVLKKESNDYIPSDDHQRFYAKTKGIATLYVKSLIDKGFNGIILYPTAIIGTNDYKRSAAGKQLYYVHTHSVLPYVKGAYNFIDVKDVSNVIINAIDNPYKGDVIVSGHPFTIKELYQEIARVTKRKKHLIYIPRWLAKVGSIFYRRYNATMIDVVSQDVHFSNEKMLTYLLDEVTPFEDTILETIKFYSELKEVKK